MTNRQKEYKLEVKIQIQEYDVSYTDYQGMPLEIEDVRTEDDGTLYCLGSLGDDKHYPVRRNEQWLNGNRLNVEEIITLGAMDFLQLTAVLAEMHKAVTRINKS